MTPFFDARYFRRSFLHFSMEARWRAHLERNTDDEESSSRCLGSLFDVFQVFSPGFIARPGPTAVSDRLPQIDRVPFSMAREADCQGSPDCERHGAIFYGNFIGPCLPSAASLSSNRINSTSGHRRNASLIRKKPASPKKSVRIFYPSNNVDSSILRSTI